MELWLENEGAEICVSGEDSGAIGQKARRVEDVLEEGGELVVAFLVAGGAALGEEERRASRNLGIRARRERLWGRDYTFAKTNCRYSEWVRQTERMVSGC